MGLLTTGTPLTWAQSQKYHKYIIDHGIQQFLSIYEKNVNRTSEQFYWGDEIEYLLVNLNSDHRTATLCLRATEILAQLNELMTAATANSAATTEKDQPQIPLWNVNFVPEFGRFMIEGTPAYPYGGFTADLRLVEANMHLRRSIVRTILNEGEALLSIPAFPLMGVANSTTPLTVPYGPVARSLYVSDDIISKHPRFATLSQNIRRRRGEKVAIRVPLFQDKCTQETINIQQKYRHSLLTHRKNHASTINNEAIETPLTSIDCVAENGNENCAPLPDVTCVPPIDERKEIHMDAMPFGMGMCCAQVTFQARTVTEARKLYDHLAVFAPIMLAMTAASPFYRGRIADIDARWTIISQSVDDRTRFERNISDPFPTNSPILDDLEKEKSTEKPVPEKNTIALNDGYVRPAQRIQKSRYDSISTFISTSNDFKPEYNDIPCEIDNESYLKLREAGIDELLAKHIAHLFIRDPLVIYEENVVLDDNLYTEHFENIQSTNWQTVRFKPPPAQSSIGWRVEFRTMEVQITDRENAAFTTFVALVSRALLYFNLNLYIPLSKVDENMKRAHTRDAINKEKFYWRKSVKCLDCRNLESTDPNDEYEEMTLAEIMLGKGKDRPGLIALVRAYLDMIECDKQTREVVDDYLSMISARATGELLTAATWMRRFVDLHPSYKHDSILNQEVVYDLLQTIHQVAEGYFDAPQLMNPRSSAIDIAVHAASTDLDRGAELKTICFDMNRLNCCEKLRSFLDQYVHVDVSSVEHSS